MVVYKELSSVEKELGFSAKTLYALSNNLPAHYHPVQLPKRDGTFRALSVPDDLLKRVQRAIAEKLLAYEPISMYATAYRVAGGIRKNAAPHVGKPMILKLDIVHFFDSVLYSTVKEKVFPKEKYAEKIRVLLTMLCYFGEVLPQGAPSSPAITNIILRDFDEAVGQWCKVRGIAYTRYCDDMTFSGSFDTEEVTSFVSEQLRKEGFFLNARKTAVVKNSCRQTVTGIVVNERMNVSASYKRKIRQEVYYLSQYGVREHLQKIGSALPPQQYLARLLGRINYVLQISPDDVDFTAYKKTILTVMKNEK